MLWISLYGKSSVSTPVLTWIHKEGFHVLLPGETWEAWKADSKWNSEQQRPQVLWPQYCEAEDTRQFKWPMDLIILQCYLLLKIWFNCLGDLIYPLMSQVLSNFLICLLSSACNFLYSQKIRSLSVQAKGGNLYGKSVPGKIKILGIYTQCFGIFLFVL